MNKTAKKTGLLLSPHLLHKTLLVWEFLIIEKSSKGITNTKEQLTYSAVQNLLEEQPAALHRAFYKFTPPNAGQTEAAIKESFQQQRGGKSFAEYRSAAFNRSAHEYFTELKPLLQLVKLYHQVPDPAKKDHYRIAPCSFSSFTPQLQFDVLKTAAGYFTIAVAVCLNETAYPLPSFRRYQFLLESGNEYFLLRHKDYRVIEWLCSINWQTEGADAAIFAENIVSTLEEDYKVNRNELLQKIVIDTSPVSRVLLGEISNSFLMLTPQFDYDGFIAEGAFAEKNTFRREGAEYEVLRKKEAETAFVQLLEGFHPNFSKQLNGYYYLSFAEAQKKNWFLKIYQQLLEQDVQVAGMDMLSHFRYSKETVQTNMKLLKEEAGQLTIELQVAFGKEVITLTELQKTVRNNQQAILLKDGSIGILDEEWQRQYSTMLKHAMVDKQTIRVAKWLVITEDESKSDKALQTVIAKQWWQKWKQWQQQDEALYALPPSVTATLRPYQQKGYEWMLLLNEIGAGACLADDMGLGKTLQTICFIAHQFLAGSTQKVFIICPASLMYNWQHELQKFTPSVQTYIYHGSSRNKEIFADDTQQVIISSYGTVRADEEFISSVKFDIVILDESHTIKNPSSQVTKAVLRLNATSRITLSGTPVMNNTFDLFSQLQFALPGMFGNREFFKREYADPIDRDKNEQKIKALQKLTAPFILRRTKEQVAKDLPPKTEVTLWCEMNTQQRWVYDEIRSRVKSEVFGFIKEDGLQKSKLYVLQGILKLRQVCNSPLLLKDDEYNFNESVKMAELIDELASNLSNHKALVFSQFTSMLDLISKELNTQHIPHLMLTGATPPKERDKLVQQFNSEENSSRVFLLSLKAGNAGLNLTAADYVFLFDPWWNTAVEQQAVDRTHRIGQTKNVFAYKMICKNTIEERIVQLQQKKKKLYDELITEEEGFVKALSEEDLEFLFS